MYCLFVLPTVPQEYVELFNAALVTLEENGVMTDLQTMWISPPGGCTSKADASNLANSKISIQVRSGGLNLNPRC